MNCLNAEPCCRGFYLRYHVSCQKVLEYNSYTHLISLTIYSLWNHSKCSIGNVYIPTKKHSLQVRYAFSEIFTWLQNHKPLVVYCKKKKSATDESFLSQKKNLLGGIERNLILSEELKKNYYDPFFSRNIYSWEIIFGTITFNNIHVTVMNKKYILNINVISFDDDNYPKYICANDNESIIELPEGNTTKKYIVNICQPDNTNYNDCFSNKYINSTCIADEKSPVTMCTDKDYASRKCGDDKLCTNSHLQGNQANRYESAIIYWIILFKLYKNYNKNCLSKDHHTYHNYPRASLSNTMINRKFF
ncbi:hypothetical protein H8356DRAFT_1326311 [Neocallimastix lanati (nom. inval.)]|nr:hypothetical protein H8356DRAFT_1326311 [Neocallimastix sp. JGI-2020a]